MFHGNHHPKLSKLEKPGAEELDGLDGLGPRGADLMATKTLKTW